MKIFILPLLAALQHYTPNDDTWNDGMEVTYNMTYNSITTLPDMPVILEARIPKSVTTNFSAPIICQLEPNEPELMQCGMGIPDITLTMKFVNGTITHKIDEKLSPKMMEFFDKYFMFNVKFDGSGIEDLFVSPDMEGFDDDVRTMAYPLHAVVDLDNLTVGNFEATDKFWTGDCDTNYEVMMIHGVIGEPDPVEEGKWETGKSIVINKKRNMDKCLSKIDYDPPTMKTWVMVNSQMSLEIKSSESHIVADKTKFISMTQFEGTIHSNKEEDIKADIIEDIKYEYVSVTPVTEKIVPHENLKSIGLIFGNK